MIEILTLSEKTMYKNNSDANSIQSTITASVMMIALHW